MSLAFAPQPRFRIYSSSRSYLAFLDYVFGRSQTASHSALEQLEGELSTFHGVKHAICVPQNRVGIYLTLRALLKPGQSVVMSPYTIADVTNMVICAGGKPVFADVDRETCNISVAEIEKLITKDTGAVLITHLHGLAAEATKIREICDRYGVPLIEDCAQALGTREQGKIVGSFGKAGVLSFGMYKNLNTWIGGAVLTDDAELAQEIRAELSSFSNSIYPMLMRKVRSGMLTDIVTSSLVFKCFTFWVFRFGFLHDIEWINKKVRIELDTSRKAELPEGYKNRYTAAQARLALAQMSQIDSRSRERVKRGLMYYDGLRDIPELIIPPRRDDLSHTYTYFPIQYARRDELIKFMMRHCRDVAAQHYKNNADIDDFKEFYRDCPNARAVAQELIFLPSYPRYSVQEVEKNIRTIRRFFGRDAN